MVRRPRLSRPTRLLLVAVLTGGHFVVAGAAPSRAAGDALDSGAFGAFVNVAQGDNPAIRSGPLVPLDMAPAGAVRDAELPSMAVSAADGGPS